MKIAAIPSSGPRSKTNYQTSKPSVTSSKAKSPANIKIRTISTKKTNDDVPQKCKNLSSSSSYCSNCSDDSDTDSSSDYVDEVKNKSIGGKCNFKPTIGASTSAGAKKQMPIIVNRSREKMKVKKKVCRFYFIK